MKAETRKPRAGDSVIHMQNTQFRTLVLNCLRISHKVFNFVFKKVSLARQLLKKFACLCQSALFKIRCKLSLKLPLSEVFNMPITCNVVGLTPCKPFSFKNFIQITAKIPQRTSRKQKQCSFKGQDIEKLLTLVLHFCKHCV